jgi:DNA polymerase
MRKIELLTVLKEKVCGCTKCTDLVNYRTQTVMDSGNPNANILFVGEAPGEDEDQQGEVFVGRAGQLLTNLLKACDLDRDQVYICNILKCRPPNNRVPTSEEAKNCEPYLKMQIKIVNPKFIVCLGATAMKYLLNIDQPVGHMRGRWFDYNDGHVKAKAMITYHPSYGLRTGDKGKEAIFEDLQTLVNAL